MRACADEMHMDMSPEAFCAEILRENAVRVSRGKHFARACAVEMHMDIKRHFVRKFTGKMPDASDATSIEHRPLTVTVRTLNAGRVSLGKHFLRACAVEMHMDMSQAAFCAEIFK